MTFCPLEVLISYTSSVLSFFLSVYRFDTPCPTMKGFWKLHSSYKRFFFPCGTNSLWIYLSLHQDPMWSLRSLLWVQSFDNTFTWLLEVLSFLCSSQIMSLAFTPHIPLYLHPMHNATFEIVILVLTQQALGAINWFSRPLLIHFKIHQVRRKTGKYWLPVGNMNDYLRTEQREREKEREGER